MIASEPNESADGIVKLQILGRDIWYDVRNHQVLQWEERRGDDAVSVDMRGVVRGSSGGCSGCSCSTSPAPAGSVPPGKPAAATASESDQITTIELHLNDKCNFRCTYCYLTEAGIQYHDNEMSAEVGKAAVDMLLGNLKPREAGIVRFFGGEPLLSFPLMQCLVTYGEDQAKAACKQLMFMVNTNGTLLTDDKIEWLVTHNVTVTISVDGSRANHDRFRKYVSGNGTYDAVVKKARRFLKRAGKLKLRATITDRNFEIDASVLDMAQIGSGEGGRLRLQTECNYVGPHRVRSDDVEKLNAEHSRLAVEWAERARHGEAIKYGNFVEPMFAVMNSAKTSYRCGAARSLVGIGPQGDVYPCHRFIEVKEVKLGKVGGELNEATRDEFRRNRVELKAPCSGCWARFFCGGGCAHNNFFNSGNIRDGNETYCQVFRHQAKLGLFLFTELFSPPQAESKAAGAAGTSAGGDGRAADPVPA